MIIRVTTNCPITGNTRTRIYKRTCFFRDKLLYDYGLEETECRTIGSKEPELGLPSVAKEYGDITYQYLYKNYLL